uniref:Proteinase inhibitor I42 chagasin domain-containing protein n=1 Tax=Alexandrium catenella TaxID=2925 RepID=A0A7S1WJR5_ALECA|mmetsp:Transcript_67449/g.179610  ORF Transcript_67449/g.179610 Transcript_67449/m.179610 type:complete len:139 (+) Transcript_67449:89-505(+)
MMAAQRFAMAVSLLVVAAAAVAPANVTFDMDAHEASLKVKAGDNFTVKIEDMISTGYNWYSTPMPNGILMTSNRSGGGDDEPPFVMCNLTVLESFTGGVNVTWLHARPWELGNPKAEFGYAKLSLTKAAAYDMPLLQV